MLFDVLKREENVAFFLLYCLLPAGEALGLLNEKQSSHDALQNTHTHAQSRALFILSAFFPLATLYFFSFLALILVLLALKNRRAVL